jgi:hypothetical protein
MTVGFPPQPVYPQALDSDYTLFLVYNTAEARLAADNPAWAEEIEIYPVGPDDLEIWADNGFANLEGELFYYDAVAKNEHGKVYKFLRCARNLEGQTRFQETSVPPNPGCPCKRRGTWVRGLVVAEHHNQLADCTIATERFILVVDSCAQDLVDEPPCPDDVPCPDVDFDFLQITDPDPCEGTTYEYFVEITGVYNSFLLDFGDGQQTNSLAGQHTYPPNTQIDPIARVESDNCTIAQTPTVRTSDRPVAPTVASPPNWLIPVPDVPTILIPSVPVVGVDVEIPSIVLPCIEIPGLSIPDILVDIPSVIVVIDDIPTIIQVIGCDLPSVIQIEIPSIELDIPSVITVIDDIPDTIIVIDDIPVVISVIDSVPTVINVIDNIPNSISLLADVPTLISISPEIPNVICVEDQIPEEIECVNCDIPSSIEVIDTIPSEILLICSCEIPSEISIICTIPSVISIISTIPDEISLIGPIPSDISLIGPIPYNISLIGPIPSDINVSLTASNISLIADVSDISLIADFPTEISLIADFPTEISMSWGTPPSVSVVWGTAPTISCDCTIDVNVNCASCPPCPTTPSVPSVPSPSLMATPLRHSPLIAEVVKNLGFGEPLDINPPKPPIKEEPQAFDLGIPSEIIVVAPEMPNIKVVHDLPPTIALDVPSIPDVKLAWKDEPIPSEIRIVNETTLPRTINVIASEIPEAIKIDAAAIPTTLRLEPISNFPSKIELDTSEMPTELKVTGIPDSIDVKIPSEIVARLEVPENLEIPLVYKSGPIPIEFPKNSVPGTDNEAPCFHIIPCNHSQ